MDSSAYYEGDLVITKFNSTATTLIGSTFIGGSGNDEPGELIIDTNDNVYCTGGTRSSDFPMTSGTYDEGLNGKKDAIVFKMNGNLSMLKWSTYVGGTSNDVGYGIRVNSQGDIYVVGRTESSNFPSISGSINSNYKGGVSDGFVSCFKNNGSVLAYSTFFGTEQKDEINFIDLDQNDDVYVYGTNGGILSSTAGVYSVPNSGNFIAKMNSALSSVIYSTEFGAGYPGMFIPTAFLVDNCEKVYISGCGATFNYPVTGNAVQSTTDGNDFYLMVLKKDAAGLLYATYWGGTDVVEHVHGGHSRFDKKGVIYQAACEYTTVTGTSGAYGSTSLTGTWDIMVFKIDFENPKVNANAMVDTLPSKCAPIQLNFTNNSTGATSYTWNFDDETPIDNNVNPSHYYKYGGTYTVTLIAFNPDNCPGSDTAYLAIELCGPLNDTVFIPNIFTPNGDNKNDMFEILYEGSKDYKIEIYNRWGQSLFESEDSKKHWNGKDISDNNSADGVYYYALAIGEKKYTGYLTLLR
jgi:gliding motility-associated-like protein